MHKIIVAGCGGISSAWLNVVSGRDDCIITALVDTVIENAQAKKAEYSLVCSVYDSLEAACDKEDADIVIDVTPPGQHYITVTTALKAGRHVFGEKPMADCLDSAEKMIRCSDDTKKEYFVMQNYRYVPEICAIKDLLHSVKLGCAGQISANFQLNPHFGGFRDEMDSPLVLDMSIHTFDAARFLLGKNPVSVYCHEFNPAWSWYKGDAGAVCIFEMENGAVFDYRGCWCAPGLFTPWNSEWRVSCANGGIYWDGGSKMYWDADNSGPNQILPQTDIKTGHAGCISDMFDALDKGTRPATDCRDNINSIRMVYKAIESSRVKKVIQF